uniref:Dual specificity protein kinase TTK n=1 Tax=Catharus ustulatus TaxID=91951 RepID=A0A8C3TYD9_CATUS
LHCFLTLCPQMEETDLSERALPQLTSIMNRVRNLKNKYKNEENITDEFHYTKISADTTDNSGTVNQIMMTKNNPEDWLCFLLKLEKKGVPQMDVSLLNRLIGRYSQAVTALPAEKYSQDESYARILVRFAELKALQDPEEARDQFHLARLNCKKFAFVHVAFAQFELSQENEKKCKQILQKAVECSAVPMELLETALQNLHLKKKQLLSDEEKENFAGNCTFLKFCLFMHVVILNWKEITSKIQLMQILFMFFLSFSTPVVKDKFLPGCQISAPYSQFPYLPHTPATPFQNQVGLQVIIFSSIPSHECLAINGRIYTVLKQIGSGGSSKVFQVLNDKKQLYAVKYVNLEEADQQTVESYKNEIAHLSKLQQHSDKIIRLYGYEITDQHIYMVMECGNIDLNSWLKKKKKMDPLERKSYWKNMLEAVHTIHEYGIIHSDLKPANFLIVDGMLKLIDFGIANQMQPDVTSIIKDSQAGTMNYMPPEAIEDRSSYGENGKPHSKISPKSDVWSLGCILYCMTYGRTPFQHITNHINKMHAIVDPNYEIGFPDIAEKDLQDVLKRCLIRNPKERISVSELLVHPYVQIQSHCQTGVPNAKGTTEEVKRILGQLVGLNSPNSISRAARYNCVHLNTLCVLLSDFI